jgi:hypothetical protein
MKVEPISLVRWSIACGLAELGGIALAALWWVLVDRVDPAPAGPMAQVAILLGKGAAGLIEGAILGYVQAAVLKRGYPALSIGAWMIATITLASFGWLLGSAPSVLIASEQALAPPLDEPSLGTIILFAAYFGLAVGTAFGAAQWLVFRRAAHGAVWWIPANMAGWAIALQIIYAVASVGGGSPSLAEVLARGLIGGLAAGLLLGFATGLAFRKIGPSDNNGDQSYEISGPHERPSHPDPAEQSGYLKYFYRNWRPTRLARLWNPAYAWLAGLGILPPLLANVQVRDRRNGRLQSTILVVATHGGERYLVSMLGNGSDWVQNVRAAGGKASIQRGRVAPVHLTEIPIQERAAILKAWCQVASSGRKHLSVSPDAPLTEFDKIAPSHPVFRIDPARSLD